MNSDADLEELYNVILVPDTFAWKSWHDAFISVRNCVLINVRCLVHGD